MTTVIVNTRTHPLLFPLSAVAKRGKGVITVKDLRSFGDKSFPSF